MKENQVKDKFIELRAQGLSYAKIALELNVSEEGCNSATLQLCNLVSLSTNYELKTTN